MYLYKIVSTSFLLLAIASLLSCANSPEQSTATKPAAPSEPTPANANAPALNPLIAQSAPAATPSNQPANPADIKSAVARVFEKSVAANSNEGSFVTGDFNGDGAEDLAVVVEPNADSLADINNELANWVLEDPREVAILDAKTVRPAAPKPPRAEKGEVLLAIIHGVGNQGWRSSEARQTFVLKNAAGAKMKTELYLTLQNSKDPRKRPPLRGDAISETNAKGSGLLYWNGAKYSWFSVSK